jgi:glutathione S-transferase
MLTIHHAPRARGLRIVWQCEEMGVPYAIAPVPFPVPDSYRAINPMGAVPFLEDDGGVAINESVAMMLYIAQKYGPTPLLPPPADPAFARVLQMTVFGEATIGMYGNMLVSAKFFAPEGHKDNWSVGYARDKMLKGFAFAAGMLEHGPYVAGDAFTLADISVGYGVGIARSPMLDMESALPAAIIAYHDRLLARPAYARAAAVK